MPVPSGSKSVQSRRKSSSSSGEVLHIMPVPSGSVQLPDLNYESESAKVRKSKRRSVNKLVKKVEEPVRRGRRTMPKEPELSMTEVKRILSDNKDISDDLLKLYELHQRLLVKYDLYENQEISKAQFVRYAKKTKKQVEKIIEDSPLEFLSDFFVDLYSLELLNRNKLREFIKQLKEF
jgi:hypothetical protein